MVKDSIIRFGVVDQRIQLRTVEELEGARILLITKYRVSKMSPNATIRTRLTSTDGAACLLAMLDLQKKRSASEKSGIDMVT